MKLHQVIVAVQLPLLIGAYNPFKSTGHESVSNEGAEHIPKSLCTLFNEQQSK